MSGALGAVPDIKDCLASCVVVVTVLSLTLLSCCAVLCLWTAGTADRIVQEGFDMRLVNHSSSYGNGVYFAGE